MEALDSVAGTDEVFAEFGRREFLIDPATGDINPDLPTTFFPRVALLATVYHIPEPVYLRLREESHIQATAVMGDPELLALLCGLQDRVDRSMDARRRARNN